MDKIEELAERIASKFFDTSTMQEDVSDALEILAAAVERGEIIIPKYKIGDEVWANFNFGIRRAVIRSILKPHNAEGLYHDTESEGPEYAERMFPARELYPTEAAAREAVEGENDEGTT